jgi:hypothetical protein
MTQVPKVVVLQLIYVEEYLVDHVDAQMYPINQEMEQSTNTVGPSLIESEKVILKFDRNYCPSNREELLPLLDESNMVYHERITCVENPATI